MRGTLFVPKGARFKVLVFVLAGVAVAGSAKTQPTLPAGFSAQELAPGAGWTKPLGLAFASDGRVFVFEKRGRVHVVKNGGKLGTPFIGLDKEVLNNGDRGLLDFALDPGFAQNGYVYLLYTVDPDQDGVDDEDNAFGRLTRYTASASNPDVADTSSRKVLLGASFSTGIPSLHDSHAIGSLRFGRDRTLLVSAGDGAHYETLDPGDLDDSAFGTGKLSASEDIGAFRSQWIGSLAGKVLRIDPATGGGLPSNPFYTGSSSDNQSRVWAYGLRNPYRFCVRPGTGSTNPSDGRPGTLYVGDVGWVTWEEVDISRAGGENFGWPCREGRATADDYPDLDPDHHGCDSIGTPENPSSPRNPLLVWNHSSSSSSVPSGIPAGHASAALAFYPGTRYPTIYHGALFFGDYTANWIRAARLDSSDNVVEVRSFATSADGPVNLVADPASGDLHLVSLTEQKIFRIVYTGSNGNPTASASASPSSGPTPLAVSFSSAGSSDPDGDPLSYSWTFGDGGTSTGAAPVHTYEATGTYDATLTVRDGRGGVDSDTIRITVSGSSLDTRIVEPFDRAIYDPEATLTCRGSASGYSGSASDIEYSWEVILHHNSHEHPSYRVGTGQVFAFVPGSHDDGTGTWLEIVLTVRDSSGAEASDTVHVYPGDQALLVDNGQPGTSFTGTWSLSAGTGSYGSQSVYSKSTNGTYKFIESLGIPGKYAVFEWHTAYSSRPTAAPHAIQHSGGSTVVNVDQKVNGSRWNYLGTFVFGATRQVVITSLGSAYSTCADAVSFILLDGDLAGAVELILDDGQPGTSSTGSWTSSGGANPYGTGSLYSKASATYTFGFSIPQAGTYDVLAWWTTMASRSSSVPYSIVHATGTTTITVDQKTRGGQWNKLGTFSFGSTAAVRIQSSSGTASYCADAVRLVKTS